MVIESTMQSGKSRSGALTHHVASEDPLDLEYPTYVSEVAWKWHDPDEENTPVCGRSQGSGDIPR